MPIKVIFQNITRVKPKVIQNHFLISSLTSNYSVINSCVLFESYTVQWYLIMYFQTDSSSALGTNFAYYYVYKFKERSSKDSNALSEN